ncbi:NAD-dependent epimerase/dehydratase family protein [Thorsellia anophelis]|uniref:Nucleoside-diphosphate-sugar epimerase n=1 Tax=Thorsellia anophelis DSM 18579 TaxID=1123402 RepID=A0A1I0FHL3_9GAMM|nr:NAD(P)-dependent oxidoreductase [Thorsellia anophelis]SET56703.1 Nucleoside-diphosphate-sugar epimerase [Thorsellia anophelis DSM 18579]
MKHALIGYTGFVGSTLMKQFNFTDFYRSTNISDIRSHSFDTVVCAGAPAQKWLANKEPSADLMKINQLIENIKQINAKRFILISTVDVFKKPQNVDEDTVIDEEGLHPYGLHRRLLEKFVESHFENHLIVRLPGLVGPGLKKNIIFDFLNGNNLESIDCRSVFQFYPMVNLWSDIQIALEGKLRLIHLTSEPVRVSDIASECFNFSFNNVPSELSSASQYDLQTKYSKLFNTSGQYQYVKREIMTIIRAYAQSESLSLN